MAKLQASRRGTMQAISGNDVMRKLRKELQEDRRGHAFLKSDHQTCALRTEPSSEFAPRPS